MKAEHKFHPDDLLNSLQGLRRAEAPPFLHTRILARLEREQSSNPWHLLLGWLARPAVAFSLLFVFLLAEGWAVWQAVPVNGTAAANTEQLPEEWSTLNVSTLYDYETPAP
ncbi:MAG TPA: hypothetical protein PKE63_01385 [Lacibacter sp.]|nr:hypothetical protein [Lacibacter sp.]HMO88419.1 hypothetical protein [Lacibacter sp.]HMP85895.1 hypothetical protein [Lacibacter sp.]